jgi:O-antigen/teichoic acid export membrane protein
MPQMPWSLTPRIRSILKNTSAQVVGRVVSSFATLVLTVVLARVFGSVGYGEFVKMTTFISFFYLIADFGFNAIYIQRSLAKTVDDISEDSEWSILLTIRLSLSLILCLVALFIISLIPESIANGYSREVHIGIVLLLPTIIFQSLITTANAVFQKVLRYEWSAISVIIGSVVSLLAIGYLSLSGTQSIILFSTLPLLAGAATTAFVSFLHLKKSISQITLTRHISECIPFIRSTIPLGLTLIFNVIYFHVDSVVLAFFRPTAEVGIYGLAYKVFELMLVVPTFFMNSMYPLFVRTAAETISGTSEKFTQLVISSAKVLIGASVGISILLWLFAPLFVYIKPEFGSSIAALRVLAVGIPFFFLSSLTMWILIALKRQTDLVTIYGISMIANIALNIVFVPQFGYMAAAWITIASEAFVLTASTLQVVRELKKYNTPKHT